MKRVHRFISNAKAWLLGTRHGIDAKCLARYIAEYTYRCNRRHDPDSLIPPRARRLRARYTLNSAGACWIGI